MGRGECWFVGGALGTCRRAARSAVAAFLPEARGWEKAIARLHEPKATLTCSSDWRSSARIVWKMSLSTKRMAVCVRWLVVVVVVGREEGEGVGGGA